MGSRLKEDEKNERIIRGLLKQPSNRKCINCNILGPQYVCTTFSTFVCTTCSGIHREFTHRVKSVSMAKFTPQEIASLQTGGNERAREIYFKEWDPQAHSAPDSSNVYKLRDFIKHVYVDKRYTGERSIDRPPRGKLGDKEESIESRRSDGYQSGSRSPPYDETYERCYSGRASPGYDARKSPSYEVRRSPGYDQDNQRHSDYGRSPIHSGVVNDWRREDRFANGRKSEDRRSSDGESKSEIRSPDHQKDSKISSPPVVLPVRDILGDNVIPLRISEPPKSIGSRVADGPTFTQRTASSSSLASSNGNPTELRRETSLIDFDAEPVPSIDATASQTQQSTVCQSVTPVASAPAPSDDNWACFDNVPDNTVSQEPLNSNSFESALTQLSVPAPAPVSVAASSSAAPAPTNVWFPSSASGDVPLTSVGSVATAVFPAALVSVSSGTSLASFPSGKVAAATVLLTTPPNGSTGQWSGMQHNQLSFPQGASNQPAASSFSSSSSNQALTGYPVAQASQTVANPVTQMVEAKPSGRRELPADLFTATYAPTPYLPGWPAAHVPGMGYHMQFNPAMAYQVQQAMPRFAQPSKSANPFDVNAEASPAQAAAVPSMSSLHAALPNPAAPRGLVQAPNVGTAMPSWMPPQSSFTSAGPPLAQSFGSAMPGTYMGQQLPSNMVPHSRPEGFGIFGGETTAFGSLNPAAASATPNASLGGNPFG